MSKTIVVCGYGTGISDAIARKFGAEGFSVALVARNRERLLAAATALGTAGIQAKAFPCDLGDPEAVRRLIGEARGALGPITCLHWNAYTGGAGDLTSAPTGELRTVMDVSVHGMLAAVREALPDLKAEKGAVLVTGGGLAFYDPKVDAMAVQWQAMGLAIGKAAQHKTVGLLHQRLLAEGVYVGEVVVLGAVKGTAFDQGHATLESTSIAEKFWELFRDRSAASVNIS